VEHAANLTTGRAGYGGGIQRQKGKDALSTVREVTYDLLRSMKMTTIFGNPGSTELTFFKDFPEDFTYVLGLQESVVLGMADGFAQATRKATLVNLHTAPGLGNAMGAMVNAYHNRTPLVVTAGQQDRRHLALEPLLFGRLVELAKPYVKWSHEPTRAADVPGAIERAYHTAMQEPQGPAFVSIPIDDWDAEASHSEKRNVSYRTAPDPEELARVARLLEESRRPAIVAGSDVDRAGAWDGLVGLAEKVRAAVWSESIPSRAGFPQDHPLFRGFLALARPQIAEQLADYDVVLVLGTPVFRYYPYVEGPVVKSGTRVIQITHSPEEASRAATGTSVVGDIALAVRQLLELLPDVDRPAPPAQQSPGVPEAVSPMSVDYVMYTLNEALPEGAVIVNEAVSSEAKLHEHIRIKRPDSYYSTGGGGLGFAMPAAVGMQLANLDRPVVCVIGDGSTNYAIQALWTAARYGAPVTYVVINNSQYGILKAFGEFAGVGDEVPGLDLPQLDIVQVAKGYGCEGETVKDPAKLADTLERALGSGRPSLVNALVDPTVPGLPG
jgi:benzoylformate decarboxylase